MGKPAWTIKIRYEEILFTRKKGGENSKKVIFEGQKVIFAGSSDWVTQLWLLYFRLVLDENMALNFQYTFLVRFEDFFFKIGVLWFLICRTLSLMSKWFTLGAHYWESYNFMPTLRKILWPVFEKSSGQTDGRKRSNVGGFKNAMVEVYL